MKKGDLMLKESLRKELKLHKNMLTHIINLRKAILSNNIEKVNSINSSALDIMEKLKEAKSDRKKYVMELGFDEDTTLSTIISTLNHKDKEIESLATELFKVINSIKFNVDINSCVLREAMDVTAYTIEYLNRVTNLNSSYDKSGNLKGDLEKGKIFMQV